MTSAGAESHLMRRSPRRGTGSGGLVVFTLEDLTAPEGDDPKAVIEVRRTASVARVVGGGVPPQHRGHGHGPRLARQAMAALRAEGCRTVLVSEPASEEFRRMLRDLGFLPLTPGTWRLSL
jgi:ribosomal protein S18 acetylase RimI-like enzyme